MTITNFESLNVVQVAEDFMDITSPLKALSDAAVAPFGKL